MGFGSVRVSTLCGPHVLAFLAERLANAYVRSFQYCSCTLLNSLSDVGEIMNTDVLFQHHPHPWLDSRLANHLKWSHCFIRGG